MCAGARRPAQAGLTLSMEVCNRKIATMLKGSSCRAKAFASRGFVAEAIRWRKRRRETGNFLPQASNGDIGSRQAVPNRDEILAIQEARKAITLDQLRDALAEVGFQVPPLTRIASSSATRARRRKD